jgi:gamma-glutamyltranspeptidase/glutathione hydrolase
MNMIDYGLNPQEALDAPRWQWLGGRKIEIEAGFGNELAEALRRRGHEVIMTDDFISFGRGQIILRDDNGVLMGATEPRADGTVAAW